jgi:hypothetical protein
MTTSPEPPTNVRVIYPDGRTLPLECVYDGWDPVAGRHLWIVTAELPLQLGMRIACDRLPAKTRIGLQLPEPSS